MSERKESRMELQSHNRPLTVPQTLAHSLATSLNMFALKSPSLSMLPDCLPVQVLLESSREWERENNKKK